VKIFDRQRNRAFTFAEILAAMMFLGLVIPVALQAVKISSDAGVVASRKATATQLGDALLNELAITDEWRSGSQSGQFEAPYESYRWQIQSENWDQQGLSQLSLQVEFLVRDQSYDVVLTTLVPEDEATEE
jgi:hypothetical protein